MAPPPWLTLSGVGTAASPPPPVGFGGGPTPSYPILTEEVGYPPSPLANTGSSSSGRTGSAGRTTSLGPTVTKALQEVLGWKIKPDDPKGFMGALNQSFQLKLVEGAIVSQWTPRSYVVQTDLSGGITGAQASIYTMAKTLLDQALPLIDGLYALDPAADAEYVAAAKDLVTNQLTNLTSEIGYLGGPRVMRVNQYFQMLLGVTMNLSLGATPSVTLSYSLAPPAPPAGSPLAPVTVFPALFPQSAGLPVGWTSPDFVLGTLGDMRDLLGLFTNPPAGIQTYINTIDDETNVTNFRIVVDYSNSLLSAWTTSIQYFAGLSSPFLGTQLVVISRQLGVISETVDEVRFVLDSVFIGPSLRQTTQISNPAIGLPPIYLEDLLIWIQTFVGQEAQDAIQNAGRLGIGQDFIAMIYQLCTQSWGVYSYAQLQVGTAIGTVRVQQSLFKLTQQLWDLYGFASSIGVPYLPPRS
jgi:hypothetical protein